ncbi:MAG TPA: substrate-binding domain-containing protein [bacterium]|nr:substrate-binding domain-containing protein [bacterium]
MRRHFRFLFLTPFFFLLAWGHEGPRVLVRVVGGEHPSILLDRIKSALGSQNASLAEGSQQAQAVVFAGEVREEVRAMEKGIPVLSLHRPLPGGPQDFLIAYDPRKEGEAQAKGVLARAPQGLYLLAGTAGKDWFRQEFREGQRGALKAAVARGDIRLSTRSRDLSKAAAVLTFGGADAQDWAGKIAQAGQKDRIVLGTVGQDLGTCRAIASGRPWVSVYESPVKLAEEAAYLAVKAARKAKTFDCQFVEVPHGKGTVRTVLLTPKVVDASNLERTVIQDGVWTREEVFGGVK